MQEHAGIKKLSLFTLSCAAPGLLLAGPTGEQVVSGNVSISRPDDTTTQINQSSQRGIINWQQFNIGNNEYVQFNQPGSSAVTLNRIVGGNPSSIFGKLSANGQIFLINQNGIFFGAGAQLDVGGLVAGTLDITNEDFLSGNYQFFRAPGAPDAAQIINQGVIAARDNGYVVLQGDYVENSGVIQAQLGTVALLSGSSVTLDINGDGLISYAVNEATLSSLAGVKNTGELYADGGRVIMTADVANQLATEAVNNSGVIRANSIVDHDGEIYLTAKGGDIVNSGVIDTSGTVDATGGYVSITSDKNIDLQTGSVVSAQGSGTGNGGEIRVIADKDLHVRDGSSVTANAGASGTQGGVIEVSGHDGLYLQGFIRAGRDGTVYIDPAVVNINTGSTGSIGGSNVGVLVITGMLNAGTNVSILASSAINLNTNISATSPGGGNLQLAITDNAGSVNLNGNSIAVTGGVAVQAGSTAGSVTGVGLISAADVLVAGSNITGFAAGSNTNVTLVASTGNTVVNGSINLNNTNNILSLTATNGNVSQNGAVTIIGTGSNVAAYTASGPGDVVVNGPLNVDDGSGTPASITLDAGSGSVVINGTVTASGAVTGAPSVVLSGQTISINNTVTALNMVGTNGTISLNPLSGGAASGVGTLRAQQISLNGNANYSIVTDAATLLQTGAPLLSANIDNTVHTGPTQLFSSNGGYGTVLNLATGGNLSFGGVGISANNINISAGGTLLVNTSLTTVTSGAVSLQGGTIDFNNAAFAATGNLFLNAGGNVVNVLSLSGNMIGITANTVVAGGSNFSINTGNGNIDLNTNVQVFGSSGANLSVTTSNGTINVNGAITASGSAGTTNVNLSTAGGTLNINGPINAFNNSVTSVNLSGTNITGNGNVSAITSGGTGTITVGVNTGVANLGGLLTAGNLVINASGAADYFLTTNVNQFTTNSGTVNVVEIDNAVQTGGVTYNNSFSNYTTAFNFKSGGNTFVTGIPIIAGDMSVLSGGDLTISGFDVTGNQAALAAFSDPNLASFLSTNGITDGNSGAFANAAFEAGPGATLSIDVSSYVTNGKYIALVADNLIITGTSPVANSVVHILPNSPVNNIGFDDTTPGFENTNYTVLNHLNAFSSQSNTFALGFTGDTGSIVIGTNGAVNVGSNNVIFLDNIASGLGNVFGSGLIAAIYVAGTTTTAPPPSGTTTTTSTSTIISTLSGTSGLLPPPPPPDSMLEPPPPDGTQPPPDDDPNQPPPDDGTKPLEQQPLMRIDGPPKDGDKNQACS